MNKDRSNGYRKRLLEEYNQLKERYRDLRLFLIGDTKLRAIDFTLMCKQKEIMENYIQILERRIEKLEDLKKNCTKIVFHHTGIIKN